MTETITLAYTGGKLFWIERLVPPKTAAEEPSDTQIDCFAPASSSKGRHTQFQSRRKGLKNRR